MDHDVREIIRRRIELRERDGHERLLLNHVDLRALLDAADERDGLRGQLFDAGYREAEMRAELAALREAAR